MILWGKNSSIYIIISSTLLLQLITKLLEMSSVSRTTYVYMRCGKTSDNRYVSL